MVKTKLHQIVHSIKQLLHSQLFARPSQTEFLSPKYPTAEQTHPKSHPTHNEPTSQAWRHKVFTPITLPITSDVTHAHNFTVAGRVLDAVGRSSLRSTGAANQFLESVVPVWARNWLPKGRGIWLGRLFVEKTQRKRKGWLRDEGSSGRICPFNVSTSKFLSQRTRFPILPPFHTFYHTRAFTVFFFDRFHSFLNKHSFQT